MAGHTGADGAGGRVAHPAAADGAMRELGQARTVVPPVPRPGATGKRSRGGVSGGAPGGAAGAPAGAFSSPSGRFDEEEEEDDEEEENYTAGPVYGPDGRVRWAGRGQTCWWLQGGHPGATGDEADSLAQTLTLWRLTPQLLTAAEAERERKRTRRLLRNRVSAQLARERKRLAQLEVEKQTHQLAQETAILEQRSVKLERENAELRQVRGCQWEGDPRRDTWRTTLTCFPMFDLQALRRLIRMPTRGPGLPQPRYVAV